MKHISLFLSMVFLIQNFAFAQGLDVTTPDPVPYLKFKHAVESISEKFKGFNDKRKLRVLKKAEKRIEQIESILNNAKDAMLNGGDDELSVEEYEILQDLELKDEGMVELNAVEKIKLKASMIESKKLLREARLRLENNDQDERFTMEFCDFVIFSSVLLLVTLTIWGLFYAPVAILISPFTLLLMSVIVIPGMQGQQIAAMLPDGCK